MIAIYVSLWWLSGFIPAVYFWVKEFDLYTENLVFCLLMGLFGPTAAVASALCYWTRYREPRVWIKKQGGNK